MLRPITYAPRFDPASSSTALLGDSTPPSIPCASRQTASSWIQSCNCLPPTPSGLSTLWSGPAVKPSSEIEAV
jgi:hypothetical protein